MGSKRQDRQDRHSSVPLMNMQDGERLNEIGSDHDWSDQELEEFSRDPLESVLMQMRLWPQTISRQQCVRGAAFSSTICLCIGFVTAFIIILVAYPPSNCVGYPKEDSSIFKKIINELDSGRIRENLRNLTQRPHGAGSQEDNRLARYIADKWRAQGLDEVKLVPYNVTLKYPDREKPNQVQVVRNGEPYMSARLKENNTDLWPAFHAFSREGTAEGVLVYANFGTPDDYKWLEDNEIKVDGKIVLIRYGKIPTHVKVHLAEMNGAAGVIMYPDPKEFAPDSKVYPESVWLPGSAVPSGSVKHLYGDFHDLMSANSGQKGFMRNNGTSVASILVQSISYNDAKRFFSTMVKFGNVVTPHDWIGKLGVDYNLIQNETLKTKLTVNFKNTDVTVQNVFGMIRGGMEPDRYILLGNHRDAWAFGAIDPSGGTAVTLELSRVFGKLLKGGWRPRRSIVFCSWAAGEYESFGAVQWTEAFGNNLKERAVAYINTDLAVQGTAALRSTSVPSLNNFLFKETQKIPNPNVDELNAGRLTLYDTWQATFPDSNSSFDDPKKNLPRVFLPGYNGDDGSFLYSLGIPVIHVGYTFDEMTLREAYPLHHTIYDTFHLVDQLIDNGFQYHLAIAQLWGEILRSLADSALLPLNPEDYAKAINVSYTSLQREYKPTIQMKAISFSGLVSAIDEFTRAGKLFQENLQKLDLRNALFVRSANDQLMQMERAFILSTGISCEPRLKHVLYTPNPFALSQGEAFLCLKHYLNSPDKYTTLSETISAEVASLTFAIQTAARALSPVNGLLH